MSVEILACPYCNARFAMNEVRNMGGRPSCPRCGEPLPGQVGAAAGAIGPALSSANGDGVAPMRERVSIKLVKQLALVSGAVVGVSLLFRFVFPAESRIFKTAPIMIGVGGVGLLAALWLWFFRLPRSNQQTVRFVLANMALMVGIGLSYAFVTIPQRRQNDPRDLPITLVAPADLPAIGYLPSDAVLVAGVHVGELMQEPAGKAFLEDPQWAPIQLALKNVEKWTGLNKDAIDHLAVAIRETDEIPLFKILLPRETGGLPRSLTVVVQTRRPYHADNPPDALKKIPPSKLHGRPLYRFEPRGFQAVAQGLVWCAADKTLVLVLWWDGGAVEAITKTLPAGPRFGEGGLPKPLRQAIDKNLKEKGTPLWLAGHAPSPRTLAAVLPFPRLAKDLPGELKHVPAFALGLQFYEKEATLHGNLQCRKESTAAALMAYLKNQTLPGIGSPKVETTRDHPPDVMFQFRSNSETMLANLKGALGSFSFVPRSP